MLSSIGRTVEPFGPLRSAAALLPLVPRFSRLHNPIDADRPAPSKVPRRVPALSRARAHMKRRLANRAALSRLDAERVIHRAVDASTKRFPFDNFKPFSPTFRSAFHLSLTLLVRYRSRCRI